MKESICRRQFMKMVTASCITLQSNMALSFVNLKKEVKYTHNSQTDFIIINGWVLLKSDIALDQRDQ